MTLRQSLQPQPFCDWNVCEYFWRVNFVPENFMPHPVYACPCYSNFALRISVLTAGMAWTQNQKNEINTLLGTMPYSTRMPFYDQALSKTHLTAGVYFWYWSCSRVKWELQLFLSRHWTSITYSHVLGRWTEDWEFQATRLAWNLLWTRGCEQTHVHTLGGQASAERE